MYDGQTLPGNFANGGTNVLGLQEFQGDDGSYAVALSLPPGQQISPRTTYTTNPGMAITVWSPVTHNTVCDDPAGQAPEEVDQLVRNAQGTPIVAAFQFECFAANGTAYEGALAYNVVPTTPHGGYYLYGQNGALSGFGNDAYLCYLGDLSATPINQPIVGMAITPDGAGYWMVAADGGIFAYGDAGFYGSMGGTHLNQPIVGMASTPDGRGYWLVAADGGIFSFGDAGFYGSMGGSHLNQPIVGMAAAPIGQGYWLVASDGGIFAFGNAGFYGSTGSIHLNRPVVGMTPSPDGRGYWFVASDGGIFAFGNAGFSGSTGSLRLNEPITGMAATPDGSGYWLVALDGGVFAFNAPFYGSFGGENVIGVAGIAD